MSYRDPGILTTPPPPLTRRRPWGLYLGGIVAVIVLLLVIALCTYVGGLAAAIRKPLDKAPLVKAMEGLPVFDDAKYDEIQTKIQLRTVLPSLQGQYPADKATTIAYRSFSYPDYVVAWFDKEMQDRGYTIHSESDETTAPAATFLHRYQRDNELVLVQAQRAPNKEDTSVVVMRFTGYKGAE